MEWITYTLVTLIVFLILDFAWLGFVAKNFYRKQLGNLFAKKIDMRVAGIFYVFYAVMVVYFAVIPAIEDESIQTAIVRGSLAGLFAYGTYGLTNWAVIEKWPVKLVPVDLLWGVFLTASTASISFLLLG